MKLKTLKVMLYLLSILCIVTAFNVFMWFWHKWCRLFEWISSFDEPLPYEPIDTDEGKLLSDFESKDRISFKWEEDSFGLN